MKPQTIEKEISSFRNVWNNFALFRKFVVKDFRATFGKLSYPTVQAEARAFSPNTPRPLSRFLRLNCPKPVSNLAGWAG